MTEKGSRSRSPKPVAVLLAESFRGKPLEKRLEEAKIWQVWDSVVGKQIAAKARPAKFQDGTLTVSVISAPWMQQLNFMKRDIADRLNQRLGTSLVLDIFLKAGKVGVKEHRKKESPERRMLTAGEKAAVAATTGVISDPELRRAFAELMEEQLCRSPLKTEEK
jgi:predicted nucleic acid-binding Zn ribbon protein